MRDKGKKIARKLRRSLHHIAIQNELLRDEVAGLKASLVIKKRYKKKSKQLPFEEKQEYHGGAQFYSPRKVELARRREAELQHQKEQELLSKAAAKELRLAARVYKQKIAEEKRVAREKAKVQREQEKAEMVAAKAAKTAAIATKKSI